MSTVAGRREKRRVTAAAKKQRRQKVIAFGGLAVLALLLVIQGPEAAGCLRGIHDARCDAGSGGVCRA